MSANVLEYEQPAPAARWWQLALAMIAMMAASSPQYVWALFVPPLQAKLGVTLSALQVTFALFSICQCGLGPMHGYLAEKFTPRQFAAMGGALVGASWVLSSYVLDIQLLYVTYGVLSGIGTGMIYVAAVELVTRWFPERRGFAIGMVAGSYGFGAVITTFPIDASIRASGYQHTLMIYGLVLGIVSILVALGMRHPPIDQARQHRESLASASLGRRNYTSAEMLRTPIFWLMFVMMSMMATGGLMVISQIGAFARDFGIGKNTLVLGMAALPLALTIDRIANGITRPFFGWVSDRIGRENTMTVAFLLEGVSILLMLIFGSNPVWFVLLSGVIFFGWGEIYSLFPAIQGDLFGQKHAANNFGILLVATAVGSILGGPLAALLFEQSHSWTLVFSIVSGLDVLTAVLALVVLKPMRQRFLEGDAARPEPAASLL